MTSGNVLVVMMKGPPPACGVLSASTWATLTPSRHTTCQACTTPARNAPATASRIASKAKLLQEEHSAVAADSQGRNGEADAAPDAQPGAVFV